MRGDFYDIRLLRISTQYEEEKQYSSDQPSNIREIIIDFVETTSEDGRSAGLGEHDLDVLIAGDWLRLGLEQLRNGGDKLWSNILIWHQTNISTDLILLYFSSNGEAIIEVEEIKILILKINLFVLLLARVDNCANNRDHHCEISKSIVETI